jgi:D-aminopeptidase
VRLTNDQTTRARDLGIRIGLLASGPTASIVDVPGVGVGHVTVWRDEPAPPAGRGVARTGVTVIDPGGNLFRAPVPAGGAVLNGAGECTGFLAAGEWGLAETPVFLTSTMQVGRVYDAACELLAEEDDGIGVDDVVIPIVAECDDSFLSDARRMQVSASDVRTAREAARAAGASAGRLAPAEGAVGAGTGMTCLGFKGGIGTASRLVPSGHTVGVLTLTNFGDRDRLTVDGVPVGRLLPPEPPAAAGDAPGDRARGDRSRGDRSRGDRSRGDRARGDWASRGSAGSCITVIVTDGPLDAAACARLARRAGLGLARTGSTASHGSGEIFLALATGLRAPRNSPVPAGVSAITGPDLNPFFAAAVEATEEAVLNSLLAATTVTGRDGNTSPGLPAAKVRELLVSAGRIAAEPSADGLVPPGYLEPGCSL